MQSIPSSFSRVSKPAVSYSLRPALRFGQSQEPTTQTQKTLKRRLIAPLSTLALSLVSLLGVSHTAYSLKTPTPVIALSAENVTGVQAAASKNSTENDHKNLMMAGVKCDTDGTVHYVIHETPRTYLPEVLDNLQPTQKLLEAVCPEAGVWFKQILEGNKIERIKFDGTSALFDNQSGTLKLSPHFLVQNDGEKAATLGFLFQDSKRTTMDRIAEGTHPYTMLVNFRHNILLYKKYESSEPSSFMNAMYNLEGKLQKATGLPLRLVPSNFAQRRLTNQHSKDYNYLGDEAYNKPAREVQIRIMDVLGQIQEPWSGN